MLDMIWFPYGFMVTWCFYNGILQINPVQRIFECWSCPLAREAKVAFAEGGAGRGAQSDPGRRQVVVHPRGAAVQRAPVLTRTGADDEQIGGFFWLVFWWVQILKKNLIWYGF